MGDAADPWGMPRRASARYFSRGASSPWSVSAGPMQDAVVWWSVPGRIFRCSDNSTLSIALGDGPEPREHHGIEKPSVVQVFAPKACLHSQQSSLHFLWPVPTGVVGIAAL